MSRESVEWLNRMILVGFTEKRGKAWHYKESAQGDEPNHYTGPIPVDDVLRRLFNFTVDDAPIYIERRGFPGVYVQIPKQKAQVTSDDDTVLGIFKEGYQGHQYQEWLLDELSNLIDDELGIGSAGLLRNRAQAFVQIEVPDSITTPEGVVFRPNILATTSFDGSLATTFKSVVTDVVCDNTRDAALGEDGRQFKVKHSKYSHMKLTDAREALAIVHTMADDFAAQVAELTSIKITDKQFDKLLDLTTPIVDMDGAALEGRAMTMASKKREELISLYNNDNRAAPWNGTAYGAVAAFNTWNHHFYTVRGDTTRALRNMENIVTGKMGKQDALVLDALQTVIAA